MGSLREKSGNDAVQLTSMLIQNAIGVLHQRFAAHHRVSLFRRAQPEMPWRRVDAVESGLNPEEG